MIRETRRPVLSLALVATTLLSRVAGGRRPVARGDGAPQVAAEGPYMGAPPIRLHRETRDRRAAAACRACTDTHTHTQTVQSTRTGDSVINRSLFAFRIPVGVHEVLHCWKKKNGRARDREHTLTPTHGVDGPETEERRWLL